MREISSEELREILEAHKLWLESREEEGRRADLTGADLSKIDLTGAFLGTVNLSGANLSGVNLIKANLSFADLYKADLTGADLTGADLYYTSFWGAILYKADLRVATAKDCWIKGAKFSSPKDRARLLMLGAYG